MLASLKKIPESGATRDAPDVNNEIDFCDYKSCNNRRILLIGEFELRDI